jgi:hydrogenase nickel incorporation protein HypA/HybF
MHEMPMTESILNIVLKHAAAGEARKVVSIYLQIGELTDLEEKWLQRYFDYLSKGTIAEGAVLKIEKIPAVVQCSKCSESYQIQPVYTADHTCPACGAGSGTLISGREYYIKSMEVQ